MRQNDDRGFKRKHMVRKEMEDMQNTQNELEMKITILETF